MLACGGGLEAGENWMSTKTSWVRGVALSDLPNDLPDLYYFFCCVFISCVFVFSIMHMECMSRF